MSIPLSKHSPGLFLKAITDLLPVPDRLGQREFSPDAILPDGAQGSTPLLLRLQVVGFHPERLELGVVVRGEGVILEDFVKFLEVAFVEGDHGLGFEDALILVKFVAGRQRPDEPPQPVDVPGLLKNLAHTGDLVLGEPETRQQRTHSWSMLILTQHHSRFAYYHSLCILKLDHRPVITTPCRTLLQLQLTL